MLLVLHFIKWMFRSRRTSRIAICTAYGDSHEKILFADWDFADWSIFNVVGTIFVWYCIADPGRS